MYAYIDECIHFHFYVCMIVLYVYVCILGLDYAPSHICICMNECGVKTWARDTQVGHFRPKTLRSGSLVYRNSLRLLWSFLAHFWQENIEFVLRMVKLNKNSNTIIRHRNLQSIRAVSFIFVRKQIEMHTKNNNNKCKNEYRCTIVHSYIFYCFILTSSSKSM